MTDYAAICPECEWKFNMEAPENNEIIVCQDCKLNLIVVDVAESENTITLQLTETDADDWGQ